MCCSSGRLDSMKEHHYYQVPLPTLKVIHLSVDSYKNQDNKYRQPQGTTKTPTPKKTTSP